MPDEIVHKPLQDGSTNDSQAVFGGFALPTSNTTYTPNQFFDVCLPYSSRGAVRLVGYLLRKTLGWCDAEGKPQRQRHVVSYEELQQAGVSRQMIKSAIDEAIDGRFIQCLRKPSPNRAGRPAQSGLYELKWDERPNYLKDPKHFRGFFAGEGNRTYIPNQFFDLLVPSESLAVLKVVGSVIRFSIGFQNMWGNRRRKVALSYQHIQNYSRLRNRTVLSGAISAALHRHYIERVEEGYFDPDGGRLSKAAVYALKWRDTATDSMNGQKSVPVDDEAENRSEIRTGNGQKNVPAERSEKRTDIKIKQTNKNSKQQEDAAIAFSKLRGEGFDARAAQAIASQHPLELIERQIQWLPLRRVRSNRLGMLRAAIQANWPEPVTGPRRELSEPNLARPVGASFSDALDQVRRKLGRPNSTSS